MADGWNSGRGDEFAAAFAEEGDLVGFDGTHLKGRQEIAEFHQRLFDTVLQGARMEIQVKEIRFLRSDVALLHSTSQTTMAGQPEAAPERDSIQTIVAIKEGAEWRIAAFQNTRIQSWSGTEGPQEVLEQLEQIRQRR